MLHSIKTKPLSSLMKVGGLLLVTVDTEGTK